MQYQQPHHRSSEPSRQAKIVSLQAAKKKKAAHRHWGALLAEVRRAEIEVTQQDIAEAFERYRSKKVLTEELGLRLSSNLGEIKPLTSKQYGKWERNELAPKFNQLLSLYLAMTAGCGLEISPDERDEFLELAQVKIESKKSQYRENLMPSDWEWLKEQIYKADGEDDNKSKHITPLDFREWDSQPQAMPATNETSEVGTLAETTVSQTDVRHILGRDGWVDQMRSYLMKTPKKKLIIIQGLTGVGKTTSLKLLSQRLKAEYTVLPIFRLKPAADKKPQDYLDTLLAELLKDLYGPQSETAKTLSLEQRTQRVLNKLQTQTRPVVLLLDDLQVALKQDGTLADEWQYWLTSFMEAPHESALFVATRQWSWPGRERSYLAESHIDALPPEVGAELFRRAGFDDVPSELLQRASQKCGGNPNLIELRAASLMRPRNSFSWDDEEATGIEQGQDHIQRIKEFVEGTQHVFDEAEIKADVEAQHLLQQVVSAHISSDALQLLEILAVTATPLALPLLKLVTPKVEYAFGELQKASFVDESELKAKRAQLLPLVREAGWQKLLEEDRIRDVEPLLIAMYQRWLSAGSFRNGDREREKGDVVAELAVLLIKHQCLLDAAQLLIRFGWLAFNQGYTVRIARLAQQTMKNSAGHMTPENECGRILLQYQLSPFLGEAIDASKRARDYRHIQDLVQVGSIQLEPMADLHVIHHLMTAAIQEKRFQDAQRLLEDHAKRVESRLAFDPELQASLLERQGWLYTTWCEDAEEQEDLQTAHSLRREAIAIYQRCSEFLLHNEAQFPLQKSLFKKRLARCHNNIGYHLNRVGQFGEALSHIEKSLELKEEGNVQIGSLAASYSEKAIALAGIGRFQEALYYDKKASDDIEQYANAGHKLSQEDRWMYAVNRGRLYLQLGKIETAENLLQEAYEKIPQRRNWYRMLTKEALDEIKGWRGANISSRYQIDWRWVDRFRYLASYDSYWWLAHAGPFTAEEQRQWDRLFKKLCWETQKSRLETMRTAPNSRSVLPFSRTDFRGNVSDQLKEQLTQLITQSRERELAQAIADQREPHLQYPAIDIDDVRTRIIGLLQLDDDIQREEQHVIVRRLYHETIEEELWYLRLIEATYERSNEHFQKYNLLLNPPPTEQEMNHTLLCVKTMLYQGLTRPETKGISEQIVQFMDEQLHLSLDLVSHQRGDLGTTENDVQKREISHSEVSISSQAAKRFFDTALQKAGFDGWQTVIDPKESGARVEQGAKQFFIPNKPLSLDKARHYLSHELAGHVARCVAGERSILGLLGIHTRNSLLTEEGLAIYHDRQMATLLGQPYDDSATWIGTLATGLASGVVTPPLTFLSLYTFFERFLLLRRLLKGQDANLQTAQQHAQRLAFVRCLRTYRGVPDLTQAGICFAKDAFYLRGLWNIEQAVAKDERVLDRLTVGVVALEQLSDLRELEIINVTQSLWKLAQDPDLGAYIVSFEHSEGGLSRQEL